MKDKFFGYIPYDEDILEELWSDAVFVLDANILLNLYRYSNETKDEMIKALNKISSRLWIPYNTAEEFFDNRMKVLSEQKNIYDSIIEKINFNNIIGEIRSIRHVTLSQKKESMIKVIETCKKDLDLIIKEDKDKSSNYEDDLVLREIAKLFEGKVGEELSQDKKNEYIKEIENRYEMKLPPGFKDAKKKKEGRKYGDCINWFNIIEYAKDNQTNIIYVTDDNKEDWFYSFEGEKVGPRAELLQEFYIETKKRKIYIYNTNGFITNFNKYINKVEVNKDITNEIEAVENQNLFYEYYKHGKVLKHKKKWEELDMKEFTNFIYYPKKENLKKKLTVSISYKQNSRGIVKKNAIGALAKYIQEYIENEIEAWLINVIIADRETLIINLESEVSLERLKSKINYCIKTFILFTDYGIQVIKDFTIV